MSLAYLFGGGDQGATNLQGSNSWVESLAPKAPTAPAALAPLANTGGLQDNVLNAFRKTKLDQTDIDSLNSYFGMNVNDSSWAQSGYGMDYASYLASLGGGNPDIQNKYNALWEPFKGMETQSRIGKRYLNRGGDQGDVTENVWEILNPVTGEWQAQDGGNYDSERSIQEMLNRPVTGQMQAGTPYRNYGARVSPGFQKGTKNLAFADYAVGDDGKLRLSNGGFDVKKRESLGEGVAKWAALTAGMTGIGTALTQAAGAGAGTVGAAAGDAFLPGAAAGDAYLPGALNIGGSVGQAAPLAGLEGYMTGVAGDAFLPGALEASGGGISSAPLAGLEGYVSGVAGDAFLPGALGTGNAVGGAPLPGLEGYVSKGGGLMSTAQGLMKNPLISRAVSSLGTNLVTSLAAGGGGKGSGLGAVLAGLYDKNQQDKASGDMMAWLREQQSKVDGLYNPGTPEYDALWKAMSRKDAAAGRNSQYGVRSVDLAAKLAEIKAGNTARMAGSLANNFSNALNQRAGSGAGLAAGLGNFLSGTRSGGDFNLSAVIDYLTKNSAGNDVGGWAGSSLEDFFYGNGGSGD